jgi:acetyl-CoA carboxylase carboxyltransferase component
MSVHGKSPGDGSCTAECAASIADVACIVSRHLAPGVLARYGFVDKVVELKALRGYLKVFAGAAYQNPESICSRHQMLLPRKGLRRFRSGI